jgi:hypothetical protein
LLTVLAIRAVPASDPTAAAVWRAPRGYPAQQPDSNLVWGMGAVAGAVVGIIYAIIAVAGGISYM